MKSETLDLFEEHYCQLRSLGFKTRRECYDEAIRLSAARPSENEETIRTRIKRLEKEPKIINRIAEIKADNQERTSALWNGRKEQICEKMYKGIVDAANGQIPKSKDCAMSIHDAVKTIGLLAELKGWKEPEKVELSGQGAAIDTTEVNRKLDFLIGKVGPLDPAPQEGEEGE